MPEGQRCAAGPSLFGNGKRLRRAQMHEFTGRHNKLRIYCLDCGGRNLSPEFCGEQINRGQRRGNIANNGREATFKPPLRQR
jgi:hypothetical protein